MRRMTLDEKVGQLRPHQHRRRTCRQPRSCSSEIAAGRVGGTFNTGDGDRTTGPCRTRQ
ncbi:hypothetical protein ACU4GD_22885 [Cupriavidus basilensis]